MPEFSNSVPSTDGDTPLFVLVVDDNEPSAKTLMWTMEMLGAHADIALNGGEAISKALKNPPDMVLLDIGIPDMDGYEICRRLRAEPSLQGITILAQTGWTQEEHRKRAIEAGFDGHLAKPVDFEKLKKIMEGIKAKRATG